MKSCARTWWRLALSDDDRRRAAAIERLMCDLEVDLDRLEGGAHTFAAELATFRSLCIEGIVCIDGNRIAVTPQARPFVRIAAAVFDAYLGAGEKRHSVAV